MNSELKRQFAAGKVILEFQDYKDKIDDLQMFLNQFPNNGGWAGSSRYYLYRPTTKRWVSSKSLKALRDLASATLPFYPLADFLTKEPEPVEVSDYNIF